MRKQILLLLCFCHSIGFSQNNVVYYKAPDASFASKSIPKDLLKKDIAFWQKVMEESHVNLYHFISKERMKKLQDSLLNDLPENISHEQVLFAIGLLAGSLNEGHIYLPSSPIVDSMYINHSVRFPYAISNVSNGRFVVGTDWSTGPQLEKGDSIVSINGISTNVLYKKYSNYFGGLETWKQQMVATYIRKLLFMDGFKSPYTIKAIKSNNQTVMFTTNGLNKLQIDSLNKALSAQLKARTQPYSFDMLDGNIAFINFRSMDNTEEFAMFLESSFATIQEKKAVGLVIDLRENSGGDSKLGEMLINYISSKQYRMSGGMKWKVSSHYKAYLDLMDAEQQSYRKKANGEMFEMKNVPLKKPQQSKNSFNGKVAVLIGTNTFSSANMLADAIKEYKLATLFGEATGECGNDFGEIFDFMLPNTQVIARGSSKMFIRANGDENDFTATKPDIEVKNTPEDNKLKKDKVLETAVNWLLNH